MISRALIKNSIWEKLNKSPTTKGFYTESKVNLAVQECVDFVAAEMFLADEGWRHKIQNFSTLANQVTIPVPPHIAMITEVRYLVGNVYVPLAYDQEFGQYQWAPNSGATQFPSRYRLVDNALYFSPALAVGGPDFLQIEYMAYPLRFEKDGQFLESSFDWSMFHFIVYRACSVLAGNIGQFSKPWQAEETQWFEKMQSVIVKRNMQTTPIRDFMGY